MVLRNVKMLEALVVRHYSEPWRVYHDWQHIQRGLQYQYRIVEKTSFPNKSIDLSMLKMAWYLHDIVYIPGSPDNERLSSELVPYFVNLTCGKVSDKFIDSVIAMVNATKKHELPTGLDSNTEVQCAILLDTDLAELGMPDQYERNKHLVKQEFCNVLGARNILEFEKAWRKGRAEWIESMLNRQRIYHTDFAFLNWEESTRENLSSELAQIRR